MTEQRIERRRSQRSLWNAFTIQQGFQQRQIMRLLMLTALNVVVSTVAFVGLQRQEYAAQWGDLQAGPGLDLVQMAISWAALMGGLGGLFALCVGLLMTHRMAGPIQRFKIELARIENGDTPRMITVRKGDEFADLAEALNRALDALRSGKDGSGAGASLDLDQLRSAHAEILEGIGAIDCAQLPGELRGRVESWRSQMMALSAKLEAGAVGA